MKFGLFPSGACVVNFSEKDASTYEAIELKAEQVFHVQKLGIK